MTCAYFFLCGGEGLGNIVGYLPGVFSGAGSEQPHASVFPRLISQLFVEFCAVIAVIASLGKPGDETSAKDRC